MKRVLLTVCLAIAALWSVCTFAQKIGLIDMREIFQSSPQVKQINDQLSKQFAPQRDKIVAMGKKLQEDVKSLQKNQSVMDKASLKKLKDSIMKQEQALRTSQSQFQQTLFSEQNKAMEAFMNKVTDLVKTVAEQKQLDLVLPKNTVLYAKDAVDITPDVDSTLSDRKS